MAPAQASVLWGLLTGGTSISWRRHLVPAHQYWPASFLGTSGSWTVGRGGVGVPGTLLGPEGSEARASVLHDRRRHRRPGSLLCEEGRGVGGGVGRGLVLGSYRIPWVGVGAGSDRVAACMLRTTQWTRASLWPSF